jgi:hypothetical protein
MWAKFVLVGEDPEDRALADPRSLGDLTSGDSPAVLDDQGDRGANDHFSALFGAHGGGPAFLGCGGCHASSISVRLSFRPPRNELDRGGMAPIDLPHDLTF